MKNIKIFILHGCPYEAHPGDSYEVTAEKVREALNLAR